MYYAEQRRHLTFERTPTLYYIILTIELAIIHFKGKVII